MTQIASWIRVATGKIGSNDFATTNDTLGSAAQFTPGVGEAGYIRAGASWAVYTQAGVTARAAFGNIEGYYGVGISAGAYAGPSNYYQAAYDGTNLTITRKVSGSGLDIAAVAAAFTPGANFYRMSLVWNGTTIWAAMYDKNGQNMCKCQATDSAVPVDVYGGVIPNTVCDVLTVCSSGFITVNGLLDGQRLMFYKANTFIGYSASSNGGRLYSNCYDLGQIPPYDFLRVTDMDGVTPIQGFVYAPPGGIFPGDVFNAVGTKVKDTNPPDPRPLLINISQVAMITPVKGYRKFVVCEIGPSGLGALGTFSAFIPDDGHERENFTKGMMIEFIGQVGLRFGLLFVGLVDRVTPHRLEAGLPMLEVAGMSWGSWSDLHGYVNKITYQSTTGQYVLTNMTDGVKSFTPELQIDRGILVPDRQISYETILPGRSGWDVANEEGDLASTTKKTWAPYDCIGEHAGEKRPNLHFTPSSREPSLIPILSAKTFRLMAPEDRRASQLVTCSIIRYSGLYTYDETDTVWLYSALTLRSRVTPGGASNLRMDTGVSDYTVIAGDYLEYDVYWTSKYNRAAVGLYCSDGSWLSLLNPQAVDGRGLEASPATNLSNVALNRWYTRRIPLPASWIGKTITKFLFTEQAAQKGDYVSGFRNIRISDGGETLRRRIWDGESTTTFWSDTTTGCAQMTDPNNATLPYLQFGDPVYGVVPRWEDKAWMTWGQCIDYGKMVCAKQGEGVRYIQVWAPPDGRFMQGQFVPIIDSDANIWPSAQLKDIRWVLTEARMELGLYY